MPTKRELIQVRQTTYKPPPPDGKRCETCAFYHTTSAHDKGGYCEAVFIRGRLVTMDGKGGSCPVHAFGLCDLWEAKR